MKLHLLHGPALHSSRNKLKSIKDKFSPESVLVFEEGSNPRDILGSLANLPMFEEDRLIVLENPADDLELVAENFSNVVLALWFDKELTSKSRILKFVSEKKGEILFFDERREISVFPFLDFLANKDPKAYIELRKLKSAGFEIQYFITMVLYLLRSLAVTPRNAPDFIKRKLATQRTNFNQQEIIGKYHFVLELDSKIKNGLVEVSNAEVLLVNSFIGK
jgi:hypothetical protein